MDILHHFILYWRDSGSKLLTKAQKHRFILPRPAGFLTPKEKIMLEEQKIQSFYQAAKSKFFQTTRIYKYIFDQGEYAGIKLTAREIDCIHFLLQNKTAEETAHQMHVTRRTVEFYLDNIRIKLNCKSKMELIKKLMPYKCLSPYASKSYCNRYSKYFPEKVINYQKITYFKTNYFNKLLSLWQSILRLCFYRECIIASKF